MSAAGKRKADDALDGQSEQQKESKKEDASDEESTKSKMTEPTFVLTKGRYLLYAALNCPFAHRVRLVRSLLGLEDSIETSFVTGQNSESFTFDAPEPEFGATTLREVYNQASPSYKGRATVPMMLDKTTKTMVNNESLETSIALAAQCSDRLNLLPEGAEALAQDISDNVTIAVYKFLFTPDPDSKQKIAQALWAEFDKYNQFLGSQPYLLGDQISLADCVFWPTVIRFDNVYARQFGLKGKTIKKDYQNLAKYAERIWNLPCQKGALGADANMEEIIRMYWQSDSMSHIAGNDPKSPPPQVLSVF